MDASDLAAWLTWLIEHRLKPWGITIVKYDPNDDKAYPSISKFSWDGEEAQDTGVVYVEDNVIRVEPYVLVEQSQYAAAIALVQAIDQGQDLTSSPYPVLQDFLKYWRS